MPGKWELMKEKMKTKKFWGQLLAGFFAVMAVCTLISRTADSITVPKAKIEVPSSGHLKYRIEGKGSVNASVGMLVILPENLRISQVVPEGTLVDDGTSVGVCDMEELNKVLIEEQGKLEKLILQLQQEQKSGTPDAMTPQALSAGKALELARSQYEAAEAELLELRQNKDQEVQARQRETEEQKQAFYNEWMEAGGEENPEAKAVYEEKVNGLDESNIQRNESDQAEIKSQEEKTDSLWQALSQAQAAYDVALQEDANSNANREKAKETSNLTQQGIQIDIEQQQKKVEELNKIAASKGQILSPAKGAVAETTLKEGMVTTGQEYVRIGTGGYQFQASVEPDDLERLKTGDEIEIGLTGKPENIKAKITQILSPKQGDGTGTQNNSQGGQSDSSNTPETGSLGKITAKLPDGEYVEGTQGAYVVNKESDIRYNFIIPVNALKEDQEGAYCLAAKKKNTILGEEYVAERINLTKKAKDVNNIAVEGALTNDMEVITESTREIQEGDRFQIEHKE